MWRQFMRKSNLSNVKFVQRAMGAINLCNPIWRKCIKRSNLICSSFDKCFGRNGELKRHFKTAQKKKWNIGKCLILIFIKISCNLFLVKNITKMGFSQINSSCMVGATAVGSATCPENNITPVKLSRIINIKGRSHVNLGTMTWNRIDKLINY